jgi:hypothetical protein
VKVLEEKITIGCSSNEPREQTGEAGAVIANARERRDTKTARSPNATPMP